MALIARGAAARRPLAVPLMAEFILTASSPC